MRRRGERSRTPVLAAVAALVALTASLLAPANPASAQAAPNSGGEYTPVTPFRVLDTRPAPANRGGILGPIRGGQPISPQVAGVPGSGIPGSGVLAVAMNVTISGPSANSYLTLWPTGAAQPYASSLNFKPGQTLANLVVSGVDAQGRVSLVINAGTGNVIIDVVGWYATSAAGIARGARLVPLSPQRAMDTRVGPGPIGLVGQSPLALALRGRFGVPASNVTGVVLNVTVTSPNAYTYITAYPDDVPLPLASNVNAAPGQTRPNLVMVRLGAGGGIRLFNGLGTAHIIVDVVGYYQTGAGAGTYAGRVVPLSAPFRAFDTREYATRLGPNQREAWNFQPFVASLTDGGTPVGPVKGLVMNVTTTQASAISYLTLFPDDVGAPPYASNLNPVPTEDIPNLAVVPLSAGNADRLAAYNAFGFVHYMGDVTAVILDD
jgi:hypothetical protein